MLAIQENANSAYDLGYAVGNFIAPFLCLGLLVGLLILVFYFIKKNKKSKNEQISREQASYSTKNVDKKI